MKIKLSIIGLGVYLLAGAVVNAQGFNQGIILPFDTATPLTAEDRAIINSTIQQIHGKSPNTAVAWANPASGHSGIITLLRNSTRQGMPCEQIEYRIMEPGSAQQHGHYVFTSCQVADGTWKLAD